MADIKITMTRKNAENGLDNVYPKTLAEQVVETDAQQFVSKEEKEQFAGNTVYTNEEAILAPLGGIEVGDTFDEMTMKDLLTKMLYPELAPVIESVNAAPASKVAAVGETINANIDVSVKKMTNEVASIALYKGAVKIDEKTAGVAEGGDFAFTGVAINADAALSIKVTDANGKVTEAPVAEYAFVQPIYHGAVDANAEINATVVGGMNTIVAAEGPYVAKETFVNKKLVVAAPVAMGDLTSVKDQNGFELVAHFAKQAGVVTVGSVEYNVFVKETVASGTNYAVAYAF